MGSVMVCCSRKVAVGYAGIRGSCSAGHYGLFFILIMLTL